MSGRKIKTVFDLDHLDELDLDVRDTDWVDPEFLDTDSISGRLDELYVPRR